MLDIMDDILNKATSNNADFLGRIYRPHLIPIQKL